MRTCLTRLALFKGIDMVTATIFFSVKTLKKKEKRPNEGRGMQRDDSILAFCLVILEHILSNIIKPLFGGAFRAIVA